MSTLLFVALESSEEDKIRVSAKELARHLFLYRLRLRVARASRQSFVFPFPALRFSKTGIKAQSCELGGAAARTNFFRGSVLWKSARSAERRNP